MKRKEKLVLSVMLTIGLAYTLLFLAMHRKPEMNSWAEMVFANGERKTYFIHIDVQTTPLYPFAIFVKTNGEVSGLQPVTLMNSGVARSSITLFFPSTLGSQSLVVEVDTDRDALIYAIGIFTPFESTATPSTVIS
jgi:hypothetical protein